mmetsp:Transcript_987/g.1871  ORF Transcript_987/g.1871 Transcript_987/m.1871 type:complete len:110 (-) Transcript_987:46-375(-)
MIGFVNSGVGAIRGNEFSTKFSKCNVLDSSVKSVKSGRSGMSVTMNSAMNPDKKLSLKDTHELEAGNKAVVCRCWQSNTFPMCDGSHAAWNKENGDNIGPIIVSSKKDE